MGPGDVWVPARPMFVYKFQESARWRVLRDVGRDKSVLAGERTNPFNEDGFGIDPRSGVVVVADGMRWIGQET